MDAFKTTSTGLLDFASTPLSACYPPNTYIKVLDNIFTPQECTDLIARATSAGGHWEKAKVATYGGEKVELDYRNNGRILLFDHETAAWIFQKLRPHIQEIEEIRAGGEWEGVVGIPGKVKGVWKLLGVNERLSFLRYTPGNFFKPHCDGQLALPDGRKSRVTLQIYLNEGEGLEGGSTRIFMAAGRYLDVHCKLGRVLIFQQRGVLHSGEEVKQGIKYALRSEFMFEQVVGENQ